MEERTPKKPGYLGEFFNFLGKPPSSSSSGGDPPLSSGSGQQKKMEVFVQPQPSTPMLGPYSTGHGTPMNVDINVDVEGDPGELYCICRSSDCTRFMIGCDKCNEWYHGDCIGVTADEARFIKRFYCQICREKNPSLTIVHKSKSKKSKSESHDSRHDKHHKKSSDKKKKHSDKKHKHKDKDRDDKKKSKSQRKCGECIACKKTDDCGICDFCRDMKKFGGSNKMRQKCRQRQCLTYSIQDAIPIIKSKTKEKERKRSLTETEDTTYLDVTGGVADEVEFNENIIDPSYQPPLLDRSFDSGHASPARKKAKTKEKDKGSKSKKDKTKHKSDKDKRKEKKKQGKPKKPHRQEYEELEMPTTEVLTDEQPQCYGPMCTNRPRKKSKYCSDNCGLKLANLRICQILPQRIAQWNAIQSVAEENNKAELEKIREQQFQARKELEELDLRHQELDKLIERAKHATICTDPEYGEDDVLDSELSVYCVTCGHEVKQRSAVTHMVKCFAKYESQTSFGSIYKTRIEGNSMFCDYYNHSQQTYCKRLKVLCPEHTKDPKVLPDEVCGCPLVEDVFTERGEFCRLPKRKCNKHYSWEKIRRAAIDNERVRQWMKVDELFEQERNIRSAMSDRAGVLGLLLHTTVDHNPALPMVAPKTMVKA